MPIVTLVARVSDGMLLVRAFGGLCTRETAAGSAVGSLQSLTFKQQVRPPFNFQCVRGRLHGLRRAFVGSDRIQQGVCYLPLSERSFPKRLAFLF
ncbi:hypothetical protein ATCC90586_005948 [Pythium insidiosum]|nr:hypothetical protein ATCC90586_005948 [Pythium insidiosum]